MSLERIIRPFQTREITPPRNSLSISVAHVATGEDNVTITIGKSPSVKTLNGSETIDVSYYLKRWMKEQKQA